MEKLTCSQCGGDTEGKPVCPYCGTRYRFESGGINVRDIPPGPRWYHAPEATTMLTSLGQLYSGWGRLTSYRVSEAAACLMQRTFESGDPKIHGLRFHLAIPPLLLPMALTIIRSPQAPELSTNAVNVAADFVDTIWLDGELHGIMPNLSWFMFMSEEAILGTDGPYYAEAYYSAGTSP